MEIAFFDVKGKEMKDFFSNKLKKDKLLFFEKSIHEVPIKEYKNVEGVVVFIYSKVTSEIIKNLPKLKFVTTQSTGFDHVDVKYCEKKGIKVGYVPFYGENTVAEHTFALILNLSRKVHLSYMRTLKGDYSIDGLRGFDLKGKTLGIIGVGHIGLHVIRMAKGFGMHVKAYDIGKDTFMSEVLHFQYSNLDDLLKTSDIISLHMPLNVHTQHFLNEKLLKKTKKGVLIINTARGGLIDTNALYNYLKKGHVGGVGIDVIEGEELIGHEDELVNNPKANKNLKLVEIDKKMFEMENVIFTPHNAFNSREAIERIMSTTIENILNYTENKDVKYSVIKK